MRYWLWCLIGCGWCGPVLAQVPPAVAADTATLNFMRWYLDTKLPASRHAYKVHSSTIRWQDATISPGDTGTTFQRKLWLIHQADTTGYNPAELAHYKHIWKEIGLPGNFFSRADLVAMQQHYTQEIARRWPTDVSSRLKLTNKGPYQDFVKAFTLPLFSLDGRRAILWQLDGCTGSCVGAQLMAFERDSTGRWQRRPEHLEYWIE